MREISKNDIMDLTAYAKVRTERRRNIIAAKARRRIALGPYANLLFENYDTMFHQIHEMLYIEQQVNTGRPIDPVAVSAQIEDELAAFNPLIPNGRELVATIMFEIASPAMRDAFLDTIGGIENRFSICLSGSEINGIPETDTQRTNSSGRASSVQFVHFPFDNAAVTQFNETGARVSIVCSHENYAHATVLSEDGRFALAQDFK